jgi:hypothetical protein
MGFPRENRETMSKRQPKQNRVQTPQGAPGGRTTDQLERRLAAEALRKVVAGERLTSREHAALKRHEKEREE